METISKYVWLLNLLQRKQRLTKKEICDYWQSSGLNGTGESLNERTFHRWVAKIEELFGIDVVCTSGYEYKIANPEELESNGITQWLVNTTSVSNMLNEYKGIRNQIVIDTVAVDAELLHTFLDAIRDKKRLKLVYHRFQEAEQRPEETVEPYCLRCSQNRWYAALRYLCDGAIKLVAFDRIVSAFATDESFELPKDFDANDLFKYDYGIGIGFGEQPTRIVLQISAKQRKYTDALPLHWSQKEIEHHDDYSLYELYMKPTRDLARAILPYGANIRVISPDFLRRTVASMAINAYKNNKFNEKVINNIINIQMTDIKTIIEGSLIPLTLEKLKYAWTGTRGNHTFFGATSTALIFPKKDGEARVSEQEFRFAFIETINAYNAYVETINKQNGDDVDSDSDKIYYSVETPTNDTYLFKGEMPKIVNKDEGIRSKRGSLDLTLYDADKRVIALIEFKANWTKPHDVRKDLLKLQNPNEGNEGCDNSDVKRYFLWLFRNYDQDTVNYIKKAIEEAKDFDHVNCLCYALSDIECGKKEPFYASIDNTDK